MWPITRVQTADADALTRCRGREKRTRGDSRGVAGARYSSRLAALARGRGGHLRRIQTRTGASATDIASRGQPPQRVWQNGSSCRALATAGHISTKATPELPEPHTDSHRRLPSNHITRCRMPLPGVSPAFLMNAFGEATVCPPKRPALTQRRPWLGLEPPSGALSIRCHSLHHTIRTFIGTSKSISV